MLGTEQGCACPWNGFNSCDMLGLAFCEWWLVLSAEEA